MDLNENIDSKSNYGLGIIATITAVIIIALWLGTFFCLKDLPLNDRGTYGDMFATINSLFSGLALAGIILTILLQRKELSLQRQELKFTRDELKRSANAQEKSEKALNEQAENLRISSNLTALNTLVVYYTALENKMREGYQNPELTLMDIIKKKKEYLEKIENIFKANQ